MFVSNNTPAACLVPLSPDITFLQLRHYYFTSVLSRVSCRSRNPFFPILLHQPISQSRPSTTTKPNSFNNNHGPSIVRKRTKSVFLMDYLKLLLLIVIVNVVTPQNAPSAPPLLARQDDEDGDLPEIALPILQIIGSALAGNASALIDNSIALIPSEISDTISSAINVLANAINRAKPPETTTKGSAQASTSTPLPPTTTEEDEDQEPTTPAVDLRGNSSDATTKSPLSQSTITTTTKTTWNDSPAAGSKSTPPVINILNSESVTNHVNDTENTARATDRPPVAVAQASTTQPSVIINLDNPTTAAAIPVSIETQDSDNKANWISLLTEHEAGSLFLSNASASASNSPLNNLLILPDVAQDNKANWASIFNSADLLHPPTTATSTKPNIRGNNKQAGAGLGHDIVPSNRPITSNQPSRNPVINNLPTWILSSLPSNSALSANHAFKNKLVSILPSQQQMPQTLNYSTQVLQSFQKVNELLNTPKPSPPQPQQPTSITLRLPGGGQTILELNPALLALLNATSANGWNYNPLISNQTTTLLPEPTSSTPTTVTTTPSTSTTEDDDDDDDDNYDV